MKKIIFVVIGLVLLSSSANANGRCGFKPYPPYGCSAENAVCMCNGRLGNQCEWVFMGC